jgi:hypothetical protein
MNDPTIPEPPSSITPDVPVAPPSAGPEYEFTEPQNAVIDTLTNGMLWVRVPLIVVGVFQVVLAVGLAFRLRQDGAHIIGILGNILAAIVCFLMARWLLRAAAAFTRVTTTRGRDISNLMVGIGNLAMWFELLAFFVKLYLILLGVLMIVMFVGLLTGTFRGPG